MKKLYFLLFALLIASTGFGQTTDLYFSMYGEGSSSNKFLEIYNGTGSDIDLGLAGTVYSVGLYANGSAAIGNTLTFTAGTILSSGDVYVIYNSSAATGITNNGDAASDVTFFNGDDAVALLKNGVVIDVIGEIGADPGSSWQVGDTAGGTANHTIVRKSDVCNPNAVNLNSFGTDDATSEWTVYASDAEWSQIGTHFACSTAPSLLITAPSEGATFSAGAGTVDLTINVQNFVVANGTGDGHIHWTIDNGSGAVAQPMKYDTTTESISVTDNTSYTVYMELVDNTHTPIVPAVNRTVNFSIAAPCPNSVGDIIITEIMQNPSAVGDTSGEYFEVYNTTGTNIDINGYTMSDLGSNSHTIISSVVVPANGYAVLGNNGDSGTNGGVTVDYEYSSYTLGNSADQVILTCSGTIIDEVNYDGGTNFPDPAGASMELSMTTLNSTDNDTGSNWGVAETLISGSTDFGTPGSANGFILSTNQFDTNSFKVFPNPTNTGFVNITSSNNDLLKATVFDILGKQVFESNVVNNQLNVSGLNAGVYILKLTQNNATATKKLVIK